MKKFSLILLFLSALIIYTPFAMAEWQVDFAWEMPKNYLYKDILGKETNYILWMYTVKNNTEEVVTLPISIMLTTDTGGKYLDRYRPEVESRVKEKGEVYENAITIAGDINPKEIKKGIAMFEAVDPEAKSIQIYITGLSHNFFWRWRMVNYSYKVTYKKLGNTWELIEHGFSKDMTHMDYASEEGAEGRDTPPSKLPKDMVLYENTAPQGDPRRKEHVEDFIKVYDAIFNASQIKNPRKALELWEAITDSKEYRETNMDFPEKVITWNEARANNKEFIETNHIPMNQEPFLLPEKALWQNSKIDGYQELSDGVLLVYTRFVRLYQKEYHYGLAVFKIKNTLPFKPIPRWDEYPYQSKWKIFDYRWKSISKPNWNQKVFAGYPKVTW